MITVLWVLSWYCMGLAVINAFAFGVLRWGVFIPAAVFNIGLSCWGLYVLNSPL